MRYDIFYAVDQLGRHISKPSKVHLAAAKPAIPGWKYGFQHHLWHTTEYAAIY